MKAVFASEELMKVKILSKIMKHIPVGSIFRNMLVLVTGTLVSRLIALVAIPYVTRLYSPADFGVFSVFAAFTSTLLPFASLRYTTATPLPRKNGTAINVIALSCCILFFSLLVLFLVLLLYRKEIFSLFNVTSLLPYWWFILVSIFGAGAYEIFADWAVRVKDFKSLAKTVVWKSCLGAGAKIVLGLLGLKPLGLLLGHIMSQAGGFFTLARLCFIQLRGYFRHVTFRRMVAVARIYRDFPKFRLPSQLLLAFSVSSPLLFSAMLFGQETTGQLGLAITSLALPMGILGNTTGKAYYAEISALGRRNPEEILKITRSVLQKLLIISALPFGILLLAGPWLFILVFGEPWYDAGQFARLLASSMVAQLISAPLVNVLNIFDKQKYFLLFNLLRQVIIFVVFGSSFLLELNVYKTILIFSIVQTLLFIFINFHIFRLLRCNIR